MKNKKTKEENGYDSIKKQALKIIKGTKDIVELKTALVFMITSMVVIDNIDFEDYHNIHKKL